MPFTFSWFYRRMGASYFFLYGSFQVLSTMVITIATVGIFSLYQEMDAERFWEVTAVSLVFVNLGGLYAAIKVHPDRQAADRAGSRAASSPEGAAEAWQEAARLPRRMVLANGWQPFVIVTLPVVVYFTARFDLPWYSGHRHLRRRDGLASSTRRSCTSSPPSSSSSR